MAQLITNKLSDGTESYTVKWRLGGTREGKPQRQALNSITRAARFKQMVQDAGHQSPGGWIKGHGFAEAPEEKQEEVATPLLDYALRFIGEILDICPTREIGTARRCPPWPA